MVTPKERKLKSGSVWDIVFTVAKDKKAKLCSFPSKRSAERFGDKLERLVMIRRNGGDDTELIPWLAEIQEKDPKHYDKLAEWGLAKKRIIGGTLADAVAEFSTDPTKKENTLKNRLTMGKRLIAYFGADRMAKDVTKADASKYYRFLQKETARGTWQREIKTVKQLFDLVQDWGWIPENPFSQKHIKGGGQANTEKRYLVPLADSMRILNACPNAENRLIFALARFGGLRIPSELRFMEWEDIDFSRDWFIVRIPKKTNKDRQERGDFETRRVPMFPELRKAFTEYWETLPAGSPSKVFPALPTGTALANRFEAICRRAGVPVWPDFFRNMRRTRETELVALYPAQDVTAWLGNTVDVAMKHYLMATEDTLLRASNTPTDSMATFMATHGNDGNGTEWKKSSFDPQNCVCVQEKENACFLKTGAKIPSRGVEPLY